MKQEERENIYDVLYDYCSKGKYADRAFVKKTTSIILSARDLKSYVSKVLCFNGFENNKAGCFSFIAKKIFYYLPNVKMNVLRYNLFVLQVVLHECEHVNQYDEIINGKHTIKNMILKEDLGDQIIDKYLANARISRLSCDVVEKLQAEKSYFDKKAEHYLSLYDIAPSERMANIDSILKLLTIVDDTDLQGHEEEIKMLEIICCNYLMKGYRIENRIIKCPTYKWYHKLEDIAPEREELATDLKIIHAEGKNMPFDKRLYMGLPINQYEYQKVRAKRKSL